MYGDLGGDHTPSSTRNTLIRHAGTHDHHRGAPLICGITRVESEVESELIINLIANLVNLSLRVIRAEVSKL